MSEEADTSSGAYFISLRSGGNPSGASGKEKKKQKTLRNLVLIHYESYYVLVLISVRRRYWVAHVNYSNLDFHTRYFFSV